MMFRRNLPAVFFILLLLPIVAASQNFDGTDCGDPIKDRGNLSGPFDINDPADARNVNTVVVHHFTPFIEEMAINGWTARPPQVIEDKVGGRGLEGGHLDFTLRAIPNHARALNAMGMWQLRLRRESLSEFTNKLNRGTFKTAECYYERGIMFRPNDGMVRMAYAVFRHRQGRTEDALKHYKDAVRLMPETPEPHYNIGLLYVELKQYDLARKHAQKAYELGYPLTGLRDSLIRLGEWQDIKAADSNETAP